MSTSAGYAIFSLDTRTIRVAGFGAEGAGSVFQVRTSCMLLAPDHASIWRAAPVEPLARTKGTAQYTEDSVTAPCVILTSIPMPTLGTYSFALRQSDNPFEVLCHGCETTCNRCVFVEGDLAPTCREVMDHTTSDGGNVTLRELSVNKGYWRATPTSPEVLACYNADACLGGVTGTSSYCLDGYEGPCACILLW